MIRSVFLGSNSNNGFHLITASKAHHSTQDKMGRYLDHSSHHVLDPDDQTTGRNTLLQSTPAICLFPTGIPLCHFSVLCMLDSWDHS